VKTKRKVLLFVLAASLFALVSRAGPQGEFEWRVQLRANTVAPSGIDATNATCHRTHTFQVEPTSLPFMRVLGEPTFEVSPGNHHRVPVEFDTRNMNPGQFEALIRVNCLTCKKEPGCREDHKNLHVFLTVLPAVANWLSVHPEQKDGAINSPSLRWSNVSPEKKPQ